MRHRDEGEGAVVQKITVSLAPLRVAVCLVRLSVVSCSHFVVLLLSLLDT